MVLEEYNVLELLGKGRFGRVYMGLHRVSGQFVALKVLDKRELLSEAMWAKLQREVGCMQAIDHPNVIKLLNYSFDDTFEDEPVAVLVLELAQRGELFEFMECTGSMDEVLARTYVRQLFQGLRACHENGVYHRDVKPENIVLDEAFQLKLADFGLAIPTDPDVGFADLLHTRCGTDGYMAPELIQGQPYDGEKADVWSAVVVSFIIIVGHPPLKIAQRGRDYWFDKLDRMDYDGFWRKHVQASPLVSCEARAFLSRALVTEPSDRPTVDVILEDPWMAGPVLDEWQLRAAMEDRYHALLAKKELERQAAAVAARRREAMQSGYRMRSVNSLERFTHTSHESNGSDVNGGDVLPERAPVFPSRPLVETYSNFFVPETPQEALRRFQTILLRVYTSGSATQTGERFKLECNVSLEGEQVQFTAHVYSGAGPTPDDTNANPNPNPSTTHNPSSNPSPDIAVVQLIRRTGDFHTFSKIYKALRDETQQQSQACAAFPADDVIVTMPRSVSVSEPDLDSPLGMI